MPPSTGSGPPAGYAQPGPPQAPPSRSKLPLILAGVGLLLLAGVVALVFTLRGGGDSPRDVTEKFLAAVERRDCAAAYTYLSSSMQDDMGTCKSNSEFLVPPADTEVKFGDVTIKDETDSKATASIDATASGQQRTLGLTLVKQDGDWKIDSLD